jgi:hypothetical protein
MSNKPLRLTTNWPSAAPWAVRRELTSRMAIATIWVMLAVPGPVHAQSVFKCSQDGHTQYQSTPCMNKGVALAIEPGPSASAVEQALRQSENEKRLAAQLDAAHPLSPPSRPSSSRRGQTTDCAALNRGYAEAWGRRNAGIRGGSGAGGMDAIESTKRRVQGAGCTLD